MARRRRALTTAAAAGLLGASLAMVAAPIDARAADPADTVGEGALRRGLRSGCRDGLAEVEAQARAADPAAPWAPTVARLCAQILAEGQAAGAPAVVVSGSHGSGAGTTETAAPGTRPGAGAAGVVTAPAPAT